MKRDYISFSLNEFILLGRKDALTEGKRDTTNLISGLSSHSKAYIIKRLKNYLLGYRMGIVEISLINARKTPLFDKEKCVLITSQNKLPNREMKQIVKEEAKNLVLRK